VHIILRALKLRQTNFTTKMSVALSALVVKNIDGSVSGITWKYGEPPVENPLTSSYEWTTVKRRRSKKSAAKKATELSICGTFKYEGANIPFDCSEDAWYHDAHNNIRVLPTSLSESGTSENLAFQREDDILEFVEDISVEQCIALNKKEARGRKLKWMSDAMQKEFWRCEKRAQKTATPRSGKRRNKLRDAVTQHGGKAQLFDTEVRMIHSFDTSMFTNFFAEADRLAGPLDWKQILKEGSFFVAHMAAGGWSVSNFLVAFTHFLSNIPLRDTADQVMEFLSRWHAQSIDPLQVIGMAITGLISAISLFLFKSLPATRDVDQFIMRFSRIGASVTGAKIVMDLASSGSKVIMDFLKKTFLGYNGDDLNEFAGIDAFCDEVRELNTVGIYEQIKENNAIKLRVNDLLSRADSINTQLDALRLPMVATARFKASFMFLQRLREMSIEVGSGQLRMRTPPLVIHLVGDSGVGKSSYMDYLCSHLLVKMGYTDPETLVSKVYYRNPISEFWDGFRPGTEIVIFDDIGSLKDTQNRPNPEFYDQIRATNSVPFRPTMAALSDKANAVFEPRVIIWTSNVEDFHIESMTNPQAVRNRVHLRYKQIVKPEFVQEKILGTVTVKGLNMVKVMEAAAVDPEALRNTCVFQELATEGRSPFTRVGEPIAFEVMADSCVNAMERKQAQGDAARIDRSAYFTRIAGMAQPPVVAPEIQAVAATGEVAYRVTQNAQAGADIRDRVREMWNKRVPRVVPCADDPIIEEAVASLDALPCDGATAESQLVGVDVTDNQLFSEFVSNHPVQYYDQRSWYGTLMKVHRHVNPMATLMTWSDPRHHGALGEIQAMAARATAAPTTAQRGLSSRLMAAHCVEVQPGHELEFMRNYHLAYEGLALGTANEGLSRLEFDGRVRVCTCDHVNNESVNAFRMHMGSLRRRIISGTILEARRILSESDETYGPWRKFFSRLLLGAVAGFVATTILTQLLRLFAGVKERVCGPVRFTDPHDIAILCEIQKYLTAVEYTGLDIFIKKDFDLAFQRGWFDKIPRRVFIGGYVYDVTHNKWTESNIEAYTVGAVSARPASVVEAALIRLEAAYTNDPQARTSTVCETTYDNNPAAKPVSMCETKEQHGGPAFSVTDQNAFEIRTKVLRAMYQISSWEDDATTELRLGTVTMLQGRIGITNAHIVHLLRDNVALYSPVTRSRLVFKRSDMVIVEAEQDMSGVTRDVCVIEFPKFVPCHGDITKFFMTTEDFSRFEELSKICLVGFSGSEKEPVIMMRESTICRAYERTLFDLSYAGQTRKIREYYMYALETAPGDCGGLVVAFDVRFNRKIIGVHMAGMSGLGLYTGAACAIHQQLLGKLLSKMRTVCRFSHSFLNNAIDVDSPADVVIEGGVVTFPAPIPGATVHVGYATSKVYRAKTSAIRESPVAHLGPPATKKPAHLTSFHDGTEWKDPMAIALAKACQPQVMMDPSALKAATHHVRQMIAPGRDSDRRVLSFEESVAGIPGDDYYEPVNRSSSPGYGWLKTGKGKTQWLGTDEYVLDNPELHEARDKMLAKLRRGERAGAYFTDTLKDELRPIEKVDAGKTRLFSAGEMVLTLLLRQYFMGFTAHMARHAVSYESCVGINPFSMDWHVLALQLRSKGDRVVAGDFTNYDGTLPADGVWSVLEVIEFFYSLAPGANYAEEKKMREMLWLEIVNSVHINGSTVYMWTHGQPSGCPFTSVLNSVLHSILIRAVFLLCARRYAPKFALMSEFDRCVSHANYGDDDVTNVSDEITEWFNQITMAEAYSTFGMTYTDEAKTGVLVATKTLSQVCFLKRTFEFDTQQHRFRGPLDVDTIVEMIKWNKTRSSDQYTLTAYTLRAAIYELAQHNEKVWNEHYPLLEEAARIISSRVRITLEDYDTVRRSDCYKYILGINSVIGASQKLPLPVLQQILLESGVLPIHLGNMGVAQAGEGGVFTPSDECVPSQNIKLLVWHAGRERLSVHPTEDTTLATSQKESLENAVKRLQRLFRQVSVKLDEGWVPTDIMLNNTVRSIERASNAMASLLSSPGVNHGGNAQADAEEQPNFAGGAKMVHREEVMVMHEDGEMATPVRTLESTVPKPISCGAEDRLANDIIGFLKRPVRMADFDWKTADNVMHTLTTHKLPYDWLSVPMIAQKLSGFRFLRCNLVLEFQVNAQPFNAGALIASFEPLTQQTQFAPSNLQHLAGIYGYPHAIYRCGESTAMQLKIPFIPVISHFDLVKQVGTMGDVRLQVLSKLTGSQDCDGTVWCWAEDIDLTIPTGAAQSGLEVERRAEGNVETQVVPSSDALSEAVDLGSKLLVKAATTAVTEGWSKPTQPEYSHNMQPNHVRFMTNHNGMSDARTMALDAKNTTNLPQAVFSSYTDEMAFKTLARRFTYLDSFRLSTSRKQGQLFWSIPVDATVCGKTARQIENVHYVVRQETYLSYLTTFAMYWRGGLEYEFLVVKTPFHSARVRVTFVPGAVNTGDASFQKIDLNKCYSQIFDLRDTSTINISIPYTYNQPWKVTEFRGYSRPEAIVDATWVSPMGTLFFSVVNALRRPDAVSDYIEFVATVRGAPDFQLAVPWVNPKIRPIQASFSTAMSVGSHFGEAQAGTAMYEGCSDKDFAINGHGIGEVYSGFRQLLKRMHQMTTTKNPYFVGYNTSPGLEHTIKNRPAVWERVSILYRFMAGGLRVIDTTDKLQFAIEPGVDTGISSAALGFTGTGITLLSAADKPVEMAIPFYQPWPAIPTILGAPREYYLYDRYAADGQFKFVPSNAGTNVHAWEGDLAGITGFMSIADDFSFGFLVGPPLTLSHVSAFN